jgi:predicted metal-dependent hydrolase
VTKLRFKKHNTKGLDEFLYGIHLNRLDISNKLLGEIKEFIVVSECKSIGFEHMSNRALGISKTDKCVLSTKLFDLPIEYLVYVILHEVSHQYQYKKYGKDLVLDVYLSDLDLDKAAQKLLRVEQIADRLAIMKLNSILKSNRILNKKVKSRYLEVTDLTQIKNHISKIRSEVNSLGLKTIEDINDHILKTINKETLVY